MNRLSLCLGWLMTAAGAAAAAAPIQIGFLWHMHQPNYYPYETILATDTAGRFSFSVVDVHNQRFGPYTTWPRDAVQAGLALDHLGAQVSLSGSLMENLNVLAAAGVNGGTWSNWPNGATQARNGLTALGNPRLDLVAFGFHHPLMPLLDETDIRMQIRLHRHLATQVWGAVPGYAKGIFPAETAFAERMIPALLAEGIDWVLVDNIHFDRACAGYPHTNASNLFAPNPADQINPNPAESGGAWVQLNNLWAPSQVSVPFGYQPHHVAWVDPASGQVHQMVAVPAARYEGNEDGRGGYGAFLYDAVMDQYLAYNTDAAHPMFVMLHHDGDNFGGGSDAYYHHNFQNMVAWVSGDPDYEVTTVEDYLARFPVDPEDVIHVENGAWAGADNGDPEFKKWLGDPDPQGWSPDRNSWAVLTAAKHRVLMAESVAPATSMEGVLLGDGTPTERAWHYLLVAQASDHWYWDGTEVWDSNVTRGCNQAVPFAEAVVAGQPDTFPPTIFLPQREPYNPGGFEWGTSPQSSDFEVWTLVDDLNGVQEVTLHWREDADGQNPLDSIQNETYAGGSQVGAWNPVAMSAQSLPDPETFGVLTPLRRAQRFAAQVNGQQDVLIDYYVSALDSAGNLARSDIQRVYVGQGGSTGGGPSVNLVPEPPVAGEAVLVRYDPSGRVLAGAAHVYLHYGFNQWNPAVSPDPAMIWNEAEAVWEVSVPVASAATQLDGVFHDGAGIWDNNNGQDWHFVVQPGDDPPSGEAWVLDGVLDDAATLVASAGDRSLWVGVIGNDLYVATDDAGEGHDHFILTARLPGAMQPAMWAKAGQVAAWDAFLADENDNDYEGWFDAAGITAAATGANGGVLEGTLDMAAEWGELPAVAHVAVAAYGTVDGAGLIAPEQVPPSVNQDGSVDAAEYVAIDLCAVRVDRATADVDHNCVVDPADVATLSDCLGGPQRPSAGNCPAAHGADLDRDGDVDLFDYSIFQTEYP